MALAGPRILRSASPSQPTAGTRSHRPRKDQGLSHLALGSQADDHFSQDITIVDILHVIRKWVQPIFHPDTSIGSIAMGTAKLPETVAQFTALGYSVEERQFGQTDDDDEGSEGSEGSESGSE